MSKGVKNLKSLFKPIGLKTQLQYCYIYYAGGILPLTRIWSLSNHYANLLNGGVEGGGVVSLLTNILFQKVHFYILQKCTFFILFHFKLKPPLHPPPIHLLKQTSNLQSFL